MADLGTPRSAANVTTVTIPTESKEQCSNIWMLCTIISWSLVVLLLATYCLMRFCNSKMARGCVIRRRELCAKGAQGRRLKNADMPAHEEKERKRREKRLRNLPTDVEDSVRLQEMGREIAALSALTFEYRKTATARRYLGKKIVCNTLAEVSRCHRNLRITGVFAGSTEEGFGDTLQQIQYFKLSKKQKYLGGVESGTTFKQYARRPIFSSDLDVMVIPLAVCVGRREDLEYEHIQSSPASFVRLKPTARGNLGDLRDCVADSGYLSARAVKHLFCHALARAKHVYCGPSVAVSAEEHGVAVEMTWAEPSGDGSFFETVLIVDFTFALRIPEWPKCARGWTERHRNWPSRHVTSAIAARGCHALAFYRDSSDDECQWRLSFSGAELLLFGALPPLVRDMYIALKALFKCVIQPYCPSLSSYHLKTIVLWIVEQTPYGLFSSVDGAALGLVASLTYLSNAIRDRKLLHYFVSGHNILPQMSPEEVTAANSALLDATFYATLHLTQLRASEAKYFKSEDFLLVSPPGQHCEPKGKVQRVIQKQLQRIFTMIPDVCDNIPISIPKYPIIVHLLTGRVFRLSCELQNVELEYLEIMGAFLQENASATRRVHSVQDSEANSLDSFISEMKSETVYVTAHSVSNATSFAKAVKNHNALTVLKSIALVAVFIGMIFGTVSIVIFFVTNCDGIARTSEQAEEQYNTGTGEYTGNSEGSRVPLRVSGVQLSGTKTFSQNFGGSRSPVKLYGVVRTGTIRLGDIHLSRTRIRG